MSDKSYLKYLRSQGLYDFTDKKENINDHIMYMLMRTQSMFKWSGLPETIPECMIEQYLQINGVCAITQVDDDLWCFEGGLGGEPDPYYQPTIFTVSNPALNYSKNLRIHEECEIIRNDIFYLGLIPLFRKYASQLSENELSIYMASINTRVQSAIAASDDATKASAEKYIEGIAKGKIEVIADNAFLESLKTLPLNTTTSTNVLGDLIELEQYLKASWYNELGLNANYNMKREALNSAESSINDDILFPLVDEMLKQRQAGAERVNDMFGTDISVELNSSWKDNKEEEQAELDVMETSGDDEGTTDSDQADEVKEGEENETN